MFAASAENASEIGIDAHRDANAISLQYEIIKDALDCCLALVMLVVTAPIVLLSMLLVRLSSKGPALYTQQRLGRHGRLFKVYKVRTMYQDSEHESGAVWCASRRPAGHTPGPIPAPATSTNCRNWSTCSAGR